MVDCVEIVQKPTSNPLFSAVKGEKCHVDNETHEYSYCISNTVELRLT